MEADQLLAELDEQVRQTTSVMDSAKFLILGIHERMRLAIQKVTFNGATAAQLAPLQAEIDALKASSDALSEAVQANISVTHDGE